MIKVHHSLRRAYQGEGGSRRAERERRLESKDTERAKLYRAKAEEIRSTAEGMSHPESRAALLRLADTYERLAAKLEEHGGPGSKS